MRESSVIQHFLEEGREEGRVVGLEEGLVIGEIRSSRKHVRMLGERFIGPPSDQQLEILDSISDLGRLQDLIIRAPEAASWDDLLNPAL